MLREKVGRSPPGCCWGQPLPRVAPSPKAAGRLEVGPLPAGPGRQQGPLPCGCGPSPTSSLCRWAPRPGEGGCAPSPPRPARRLWRQLVPCPCPSPSSPPLPLPTPPLPKHCSPPGPPPGGSPATPTGVRAAPARGPEWSEAPQAAVNPGTMFCPTPDTCPLRLQQGVSAGTDGFHLGGEWGPPALPQDNFLPSAFPPLSAHPLHPAQQQPGRTTRAPGLASTPCLGLRPTLLAGAPRAQGSDPPAAPGAQPGLGNSGPGEGWFAWKGRAPAPGGSATAVPSHLGEVSLSARALAPGAPAKAAPEAGLPGGGGQGPWS